LHIYFATHTLGTAALLIVRSREYAATSIFTENAFIVNNCTNKTAKRTRDVWDDKILWSLFVHEKPSNSGGPCSSAGNYFYNLLVIIIFPVADVTGRRKPDGWTSAAGSRENVARRRRWREGRALSPSPAVRRARQSAVTRLRVRVRLFVRSRLARKFPNGYRNTRSFE